jgi:hypothetical protein
MPKKKNFLIPNQHIQSQRFSEYKERLDNFYRDLKYMTFMSDKHEIARQDVLLTPKGPVELYRRDMNGREKFMRENKLPKIKDRSSRSYINKISNSQDNYSRHSSIPIYDHSIYNSLENSRSSALLRDNGRYGLAFDWYSPQGRISQVLHEDVEVLSTRPTSRGTHKYSYSPISSRAVSYYGDDYYDTYSHYSDDEIFNKENYDIYEYYEYEVDDEDGKPKRFFSSRRRKSERSLTPVPPIPLASKNRKPRKIVSYIDYDSHDNPKIQKVVYRHKKKDQNKESSSPLKLQIEERPASSPKGKELWKKVDNYSQNDSMNYFEENLNVAKEVPVKNANISSFDENFILKENNSTLANNQQNNHPKSNFWGNIRLSPTFQEGDQQELHLEQKNQQNEQENEPIYSFTNVTKGAENKNDSMINFRQNFKKRQPIKSAMKIASEIADYNSNNKSSKFDDIPGNNAVRLV